MASITLLACLANAEVGYLLARWAWRRGFRQGYRAGFTASQTALAEQLGRLLEKEPPHG